MNIFFWLTAARQPGRSLPLESNLRGRMDMSHGKTGKELCCAPPRYGITLARMSNRPSALKSARSVFIAYPMDVSGHPQAYNHCSPTRTLYGSGIRALEFELVSSQLDSNRRTLQKRITRVPRFIKNRIRPVASDIELFLPSCGA